MDARGLLRPDPWLAHELGREVFSLICPPDQLPGVGELARAISELASRTVMIQAKVTGQDLRVARLLEGAGFGLVETGLVFERKLLAGQAAAGPALVRPAREGDEEAVASLAGQAFVHSRLLRDPLLGPELGGRVKQAWARNHFRGGRGDAILVAEQASKPVGFVLLLSRKPALVVDLIAVTPEARGQGVAGDLLKAAQEWGRGLEVIRAGTQLTNAASLALYQSQGFALISGHLVYHYHR
jgi:GNAT superfamily N-acetyltransferase